MVFAGVVLLAGIVAGVPSARALVKQTVEEGLEYSVRILQQTTTEVPQPTTNTPAPVSESAHTGKMREAEKEQQADAEVAEPPPLRHEKEGNAAESLHPAAVVALTNEQRRDKGANVLTVDQRLADAAEAKAQDMLDRQYFAHTSPDGRGAAAIVAEAGYDYIAVGENLAMGAFSSERDLVQSWMDSPGHRANILNEAFTEIGVGVVQGAYDGEEVWMAVQEFGKPTSACPTVDDTLKQRLERRRAKLKELERRVEQQRAELEQTRPKHGSAYEEKRQEYNALVERYNTQLTEVKSLREQYNTQVRAFNACAEE